jgi:hypothetical protein
MRRATVRLSLVAAGLAAIGLAMPASAGSAPTKLVITDPAGDSNADAFQSLEGDADDIVKLTFTTTGATTTKKVGKKVVKTYTPKVLVITLETLGNIMTSGATQYNIEGSADGCGNFYLYVAPGTAMESFSGFCADDDAADFAGADYKIAGKTITFTVPLGSVPGIKAGSKLDGLRAYTASVEPVTGELGPWPVLVNDETDGEAVYKVG